MAKTQFLLYINLAWVSVCLYPINVKTAEPIGPKFFVGHHVTQGRFMNDKNFKKCVLKVFNFVKKKFADFKIFFGAFSNFTKIKSF